MPSPDAAPRGARSVVAALLSLIVPGAGHFLVGRFARGVFWIALLFLVTVSVPLTKAVGLIGLLVFRIAGAVDAFRVRVTPPPGWVVVMTWAALVVWSVLAATVVRDHFTQTFTIPSGAMMDTLLVGDYIMTDNAGYRFAEPRRADIVVFKYPKDETLDFIQRIVALPGEVVQVRGHHVYINGAPLDEPYARRDPAAQRGLCAYGYGCEPTIVPPRSYFVMGDLRANSQDSRYWGFVKREKIKGRAFLVYWSWDGDAHRLRWERLGHALK